MTETAARALIEGAVSLVEGDTPVWADLGSGSGTFTEALAHILGPLGTVHAVERERAELSELRSMAQSHDGTRDGYAKIISHQGDFTKPLSLPPLSGILMANALHFAPHLEQAEVLSRLKRLLQPHGRIVLVEYNRDTGHQWVPYPISSKSLPALAGRAGLGKPHFVATAPSAFGGDLYSAWMSPE